jgi:hypothetical protein
MNVGILLTRGKHVHDRIMSLRVETWAHRISLTPSLFIELPVPNQESERCALACKGYRVFFFLQYNY